MGKLKIWLVIVLVVVISGCGNNDDNTADDEVTNNICFSIESPNPCFDPNKSGITSIVTDKPIDQVISEQENSDGFITELGTTHITKSFSTTITDFECFEAMSESELVIKTEEDWNRFRNSCFFSEFPIADIDFSDQMAIVAIDDLDGVGINIESVLEFNSEIVVIIKDDVIQPLEDFLRFRFHIVSVQATDKIVNFIRVKGSDVNTCFSIDSSETCLDSNLKGTTTTVLDKPIEEVISEEKSRDGFIGELEIRNNFKNRAFGGPPESFLNPECVQAWKENEGIISNKEDWDEFRISCFFSIGFSHLPEVDFSDEIILLSIQDTDGIGTVIESVLEFEDKLEVVIRDDVSSSTPPILLFLSNIVSIQRKGLPVDFIRVKNPGDIDVIRGCLGKKAFSIIPECLAESIVSFGILRCDCEGDKSGNFPLDFGFIVNGDASPIVEISGVFFGLEEIDCTSLSLSGQVSGTFEQMTTPELGILEFFKTISGEESEDVSCDCIEEPCTFVVL